MADHRDLLIEIGCEELPPKALQTLASAFANHVWKGLSEAGVPRHGELRSYASPRRLGVLIEQLEERGVTERIKNLGPAVKAAFDAEGRPTPAAIGFARNCGVAVKDLQTLQTDKGQRLYFEGEKPGRATAELVPAIVQKALDKLPTPRRMRWGNGTAEFVRPVHWLVLLYGETVIEAELLGVRANRYTRGHRFHYPAPIHLDQPRDYADALEKRGQVIPDFEKRRARVRELALTAAVGENARVKFDEALLDEVTALCEWPQALVGSFDPSFLELPEETIIAVLQDQQRYFPLRAADGRLLPRFIVIANITSRDPAAVRHGNERVIRPRLADAVFFWNQDRRAPLHTRLEALKEVVFQKQLGSLHDKTQRLSTLAIWIAKHIGADATLVKRAAELSRCDLLTQMVGEFPELQGIMGRYYAAHDGEGVEISTAIDEMYHPRFAGDVLPQTASGKALALADRLDTLIGIFGIGELPTGEKDPYGLRRAALGALRILIEGQLDLDMLELLRTAAQSYRGRIDGAITAVLDFMIERLRGYYLDNGIAPDVFEAVLAAMLKTSSFLLPDFSARLHAVTEFRKLPEAASLAAANKRIANILKKSAPKTALFLSITDLQEPAERALHDALQKASVGAAPLLAQREYVSALSAMAALKEPVDAFFDKVLVMSEDETVRNNRLALLSILRGAFLRVADISLLQG